MTQQTFPAYCHDDTTAAAHARQRIRAARLVRFGEKAAYYLREHGIAGLTRLFLLKLWRKTVDNRTIVYYMGTASPDTSSALCPYAITLLRYHDMTAIPPAILASLCAQKGGCVITEDYLETFFGHGADLWLALVEGGPAGYYWSVRQGINGFYTLPLTDTDCVLLGGEVFSRYRGRRINVAMVHKITRALGDDGISKVFIGSKTWNSPQLKSLARTGFKKLGTARSFGFFTTKITLWDIAPTGRD